MLKSNIRPISRGDGRVELNQMILQLVLHTTSGMGTQKDLSGRYVEMW